MSKHSRRHRSNRPAKAYLVPSTSDGGDNGLNYEFHTLLIKLLPVEGNWSTRRNATTVELSNPTSPFSKARAIHPAPRLLACAQVRSSPIVPVPGLGGYRGSSGCALTVRDRSETENLRPVLRWVGEFSDLFWWCSEASLRSPTFSDSFWPTSDPSIATHTGPDPQLRTTNRQT